VYGIDSILEIWYFLGPIAFIVLLVQLTKLKGRIDMLERRLRPEEDKETAPSAELADSAAAPPVDDPVKVAAAEAAIRATPAAIKSEVTPPPSGDGTKFEKNEAQFASRWFIWLGAIAIALGGGFLIKYSVDAGLLGPTARVVLASLLGFAAMGAGVWLRRNPRKIGAVAIAGERIPAALSAAGLFIAFAALYGGHALYALYPPLVAFAALVMIAIAGVLVAIFHGRYGPFIAGLGMLGAYLVPLLVHTGDPSSTALFSYLGILNVVTLSLLRWRGWTWLGWGVLIGASLWPLIFMTGVPIDSFDAFVMAIYGGGSALLIGLVMGTGHSDEVRASDDFKVWRKEGVLPIIAVTYVAAVAASILFLILMDEVSFAPVPMLVVMLSLAGFAVLSIRVWTLAPLAAIAGAAACLLLYTWHLASGGESSTRVSLFPVGSGQMVAFYFGASLAAFGVGAIMLWRSRPGFWASIAVIIPIGLLIAAYRNLMDDAHSFPWNLMAIFLFCVFDVLAGAVIRRYKGERKHHALGAIAVGATAAFTLAATLTFDQAWLTVTLALQVPVLAFIESKYRLPILRVLAGVITGAVLVRLALNPNVFAYPLSDVHPLLNWMWYGYGVPAMAFALAARWFVMGQEKETLPVQLMQAAALTLFVLLATLEIRAFVNQDLWQWGSYSLAESASHVIAWMTIATGLYWRYGTGAPIVLRVAARILFAYALLHILLFNLLAYNLLYNVTAVGEIFFFNLLTLSYLIPGLLAAAVSAISMTRPKAERLLPLGLTNVASFILLFTYLNFLVRHLFHGSILALSKATAFTQAELYTYSATWLLVAVVLITYGLWANIRAVRAGALVLLAIVVVKVFLVDMSELAGIFRVISFLGLGAGLLGLGYAYQRFIVTQDSAPSSDDKAQATD